MRELEVKILEINKEEVIKKLEKLGAKKYFEGEIIALHYDFNDDSLMNSNKLLRLRKKGKYAEITYKKKISNDKIKISEELEVKINNFAEMKKILYKIGLREVMQLKKYRTGYVLDNVHFEIDSYESIPTLLEIEASTESKLEKYVKKLGFSMKNAKPWTTKEVLYHYSIGKFIKE